MGAAGAWEALARMLGSRYGMVDGDAEWAGRGTEARQAGIIETLYGDL